MAELPKTEIERLRARMLGALLDYGNNPIPLDELLTLRLDSRLLPASSAGASQAREHPVDGCRYCGARHLAPASLVNHREQCQLRTHLRDWKQTSTLIARMQSLAECPCAPLPRRGCEKAAFGDLLEKANHLEKHVESWFNATGRKACPVRNCSTTFDSSAPRADARVHLQTQHQLLPAMSSSKDFDRLLELCTSFCAECQMHLTPQASWRRHCDMHLAQVLQRPEDIEYDVLLNGPIVQRPGRCPFCLHNETLSAETRWHGFGIKQELQLHIQGHLVGLFEKGAPISLVCPVAACQAPQGSVKSLGNHLVTEHRFALFDLHPLEAGKGMRLWDGDIESLAFYRS